MEAKQELAQILPLNGCRMTTRHPNISVAFALLLVATIDSALDLIARLP